MTFNIETSEVLDKDAARDFISMMRIGRNHIHPTHVMSVRPDFTIAQVNDFLKLLNRAGVIDIKTAMDRRDTYFDITDLGASLYHSKLRSRIDPEQAAACLDKGLAAVRAWNADTRPPVLISSVKLFGSYLENKVDYGDVDIELVVDLKPHRLRELSELYAAVPANRKNFYSANPNEIAMRNAIREYWRDRAISKIERSHADLSVVTPGTIEALGSEYREIMAFNASTGEEIEPEMVTHGRSTPRIAYERPEVYEGNILEIPNNEAVQPGRLIDTNTCGIQLRNNLSVLYPWTEAETHLKHQTVLSFISETENHPAWDLSSETPFDKIREIVAQAASLNLVDECSMGISVEARSISLTFEIKSNENRFIPMIEFTVQKTGDKYEIDLIPYGRFVGDDFQENVKPMNGEYIAMARSLYVPMKDIMEIAKFPTGLKDGSFSFFWNLDSADPKFPNFNKLAKSLKTFVSAFRDDDVTTLINSVRSKNEGDRICIASLNRSIEFSEDHMKSEMKSTLRQLGKYRAPEYQEDPDLLCEFSDLIQDIREAYDFPYLTMSASRREILDFDDPQGADIDGFKEKVVRVDLEYTPEP